MKISDPNNPYVDYLEEDLYAFLNSHTLERAPGTKSEYSNLGQGLLGHLLSLKAKSSYEDLIRNRIAVPLKMSSTTITIDKELQSRLAPGHDEDGKPAANWDGPVLAGAGGLRTTVNDMLLFAAANLVPPKDKLGEAIEMAWTIHQKPIEKGEPPLGLGWHVMPDGSRWHNGETGGYHSMILVNRNLKTSVVLLTNTAAGEVDQLAIDILKMISGAKVTPRKFEKPIDVSPEALQKFVGSYEVNPNVVFSVGVDDGKLIVAVTGQPAYQVYARTETVWFYKVVDATITFNVDKKGKCDSLVLLQGGVKLTAKRTKETPFEAVPKSSKPIEVSAEAIQKLVGSYEFAPGLLLTVEAKSGTLTVKLTGQPPLQVFPHSEVIWFAKAVEATILFNVDKNDKCDSLVLLQGGLKQTAKRKDAPAEVMQKFEKAIDVPAEALQKFVGRYEFAPGLALTIEAKNGKLMATLTGQSANQIYAGTETVWFPKGIDATITFNVDKEGKCDSLVLFQNGNKQTAKRTKDVPPEVMPKFEKAIDVPAEALQKFVGRYEFAPGLAFTIEAKDGKLMATLTGQSANQIYAGTETVWFYKVLEATITFNVDKNGKCDSLVLFQNGIKQTAKRKK